MEAPYDAQSALAGAVGRKSGLDGKRMAVKTTGG